MLQMIPVEQAKQLIEQHITRLSIVSMPLHKAMGLVLAEDLIAPYNIPAYPQSSMDGYALAFDSVGTDIVIDGEMAAGSGEFIRMKRGVAVRIFTGAAVPEGADTVVPQEKIKLDGNKLLITDANLKRGDNVRPVGSEIRKA
ncbi:MAG TPA: hypothetical protein VK166_18790, partial [Chitinophagaceae bacterium]|nr:hypothetical protein [Chitinophagaceae bacterium]